MRRLLIVPLILLALAGLTSCGGHSDHSGKPTRHTPVSKTKTDVEAKPNAVIHTTIKVDGHRHHPSLAPQNLTVKMDYGMEWWHLKIEVSYPDRCNRNTPDKGNSKEVAIAVKSLDGATTYNELDTSQVAEVADEGDGRCEFKGDAIVTLTAGEYYLTLDGTPQPVTIKLIKSQLKPPPISPTSTIPPPSGG